MVIQSAGTGLTFDSGNFFVVFAADAGDALGVEVAVLPAGFWAQPAVSSARAPKNNKILFIDPPELNVFWKQSVTRCQARCRAFAGKSCRSNRGVAPRLN